MKQESLLLMIALVAISCSAAAQTGKVFSEKEVTESALIQALTPDSAAGGFRTRNLRIDRDNPVGTVAAKPASASLLITFETNSAELTERAKQSLDVVGQALSSNKLAEFRFALQGHADPRGNSESNLRLSQLRAESVRQYLVQNKHIKDGRLEAVGKGDTEVLNMANPAAPENRRVTIVNLAQ